MLALDDTSQLATSKNKKKKKLQIKKKFGGKIFNSNNRIKLRL